MLELFGEQYLLILFFIICGHIPGILSTLLNWNVNGMLAPHCDVNPINIYGSMIIRGLTHFVCLEPVKVNFDILICGPISGRLSTLLNWNVNGILAPHCDVNPINIYGSMIIRGLAHFVCLEPVRVNFDILICGPISGRLATLLNWDMNGVLPKILLSIPLIYIDL
jgi:uncharacterized membrane protein